MLTYTVNILFAINHPPIATNYTGVYLIPCIDGGYFIQTDGGNDDYIDHYPSNRELLEHVSGVILADDTDLILQ